MWRMRLIQVASTFHEQQQMAPLFQSWEGVFVFERMVWSVKSVEGRDTHSYQFQNTPIQIVYTVVGRVHGHVSFLAEIVEELGNSNRQGAGSLLTVGSVRVRGNSNTRTRIPDAGLAWVRDKY
jgi:hypothetical protein